MITNYLTKLGQVISDSIQKPMIGLILAINFTWIYELSNLQLTLVLLAISISLDFISGCFAYYCEVKSGLVVPDTPYIISSKQGRLTGVKIIAYGGAIAIVLFFEVLVFKKNLNLVISGSNFSATQLVATTFIIVELYSTLFENTKRAGLDLIKKISDIIDSIIKVKTKLAKIFNK